MVGQDTMGRTKRLPWGDGYRSGGASRDPAVAIVRMAQCGAQEGGGKG